MKPEEKAEELINRFRENYAWVEQNFPTDLWRDAKESALICAKECCTASSLGDYSDLPENQWIFYKKFWQEVIEILQSGKLN